MINKFHSFNTDDAMKYGLEKAIILQHMRYWLDKHKAHKEHAYKYTENPDSPHCEKTFYWTRFTGAGLQQMFPYLGSEQKLRRLIRELEKDGVIISQQFSKKASNHTKSYSIPHEYSLFKNEQSNVHEQTIECSNLNNRTFKNEQSLRSNKDLIENTLSISESSKFDDLICFRDLLCNRELEIIAHSVGLVGDIECVFHAFIGHLETQQAQDMTKAQWLGAWRKWCAREKAFNKTTNQRKQNRPSEPVQTDDNGKPQIDGFNFVGDNW